MPCQLVQAVSGALTASYRQHGAVPPATIIDTVVPLAPLIASAPATRAALITEALAEVTAQPTLDATCVCALAALLHAGSTHAASGDAAVADAEREFGRQLCARLWDALVSHQSKVEELECAAQCVARLFPAYGAIVVDAAVEALSVPGDSAAMPRAAAVEVLGCVATSVLQHGDAPWATEQTQRLIDTALTCVGMKHESGATVPAVTRRVLIPLMRSASVINETRGRAVALVHGFQAKGQLAEAVVLVAALFDFLFPPPPPSNDNSSKAGAAKQGSAKKGIVEANPTQTTSTSSVTANHVEKDLRHEAFIWDLLIESLESSGPRVSALGGPIKVAGLHLQAIYLLKRLVSYTKDVDGLAPTLAATYHRAFTWRGKDSDKAWDQYFLVFDCLNEYGLHIVSPALERVAGLLAAATSDRPAIGMPWVETLVDKAINHPNVGARKLGLGVLWSSPIDVVVARFTDRLVCDTAYVAACDPRLCAEIDKVAMPGSFLDCKAFNGRPCHDLPVMQPVAERFEAFYTAYLRASAPAQRLPRLLMMVSTTLQGHASRFGVCLTCRFVKRLSECVDVRADIGSPELVAALHTMVTAEVQDKLSYWLEARLDAVLLDALLNLATPSVVASPTFVNFVAQLTRAGTTGGASLSSVDVSGGVGPIGTALPHDLMIRRLAVSAPTNPQLTARIAQSQLTSSKVDEVVVRSATVNPVAIKQLVTLLDQEASRDGLATIAERAAVLAQQTAMAPKRKVATLLLFAESAAVLPAWLARPEDEAAVSAIVQAVLQVATSELTACATAPRLTEASVTQLRDEEWFIMRSESFDVVCAAAYQAVLRLRPHKWRGAVLPVFLNLLDLAAGLWSTPVVAGACEYARMMVVRNTLRLMHTLLMAALTEGSQHSLADWTQALSVTELKTLVSRLIALPPLHLSAADVPSMLTAEGGWGGCVAQYGRSVADCVSTLVHALPPAVTGGDDYAAFAKTLGDYGCSMLDECSQCNLSAAFDITCWACRHVASREVEGTWLTIMHQRLADEHIRREGHRCSVVLGYTLVQSKAHAVADDIITNVLNDPEASDRLLYSLGTAMCAAVLNATVGDDVYARLEDHLIHLAVLTNTYGHDEEMDAWLAVTEPVLTDAHWAELKALRPSSNGASAVARCAAVSTLLHHHAQSGPAARGRFVLKLLDLSENHPALTKNPCMPDSGVHRCRIRLWQLLVACVPLLEGLEAWSPIAKRLAETSLEAINMGSVRRYIEFMMMAALNACPELYVLILAKLADVDLRAQVCGSHALIALHALKRHGVTHRKMREDMVPVMVRLCASHFHILRLTCQIGLHDLGSNPEFAQYLSADALAIVQLVEHNADAKKFRDRHLDVVVFDEEQAMTPVAIFCTQRKEGENWLHDSVPPSAFDRVSFAHNELLCLLGANSPMERYRCRRLLEGAGAVAPTLAALRRLRLVPHSVGPEDEYMRYPAELWAASADGPVKEKNAGNSESDNLQRKVTSWWNSEVHNELHPRALGTRVRQQLVIVATLLDYPVNIAGLCRCAEIFAVEKVVVADRKIFTNPQFVAVARSAELWMPWEEVPPGSLAAYLDSMRRLGYTIAGVEQTADSVPLQTYEFPQRTVLVLGAEGTGIPANFLPCLDVCLEIPQFGLIRSLNVHVTGAVAMYEFTRQHLMDQRGVESSAALTANLAAALE